MSMRHRNYSPRTTRTAAGVEVTVPVEFEPVEGDVSRVDHSRTVVDVANVALTGATESEPQPAAQETPVE